MSIYDGHILEEVLNGLPPICGSLIIVYICQQKIMSVFIIWKHYINEHLYKHDYAHRISMAWYTQDLVDILKSDGGTHH